MSRVESPIFAKPAIPLTEPRRREIPDIPVTIPQPIPVRVPAPAEPTRIPAAPVPTKV